MIDRKTVRETQWSLLSKAQGLVLFLMFTATAGTAQTGPQITLSSGVWAYDLSGTGTAPFMAIRSSWAMASWLVVEPGLTFASLDTQLDEALPLLLPEVQVQIQANGERVRPFIGAGLGWFADLRGNRHGAPLLTSTLSLTAGARIRVAAVWQLRPAFALRGVEGFGLNIGEVSFGIGRSL